MPKRNRSGAQSPSPASSSHHQHQPHQHQHQQPQQPSTSTSTSASASSSSSSRSSSSSSSAVSSSHPSPQQLTHTSTFTSAPSSHDSDDDVSHLTDDIAPPPLSRRRSTAVGPSSASASRLHPRLAPIDTDAHRLHIPAPPAAPPQPEQHPPRGTMNLWSVLRHPSQSGSSGFPFRKASSSRHSSPNNNKADRSRASAGFPELDRAAAAAASASASATTRNGKSHGRRSSPANHAPGAIVTPAVIPNPRGFPAALSPPSSTSCSAFPSSSSDKTLNSADPSPSSTEPAGLAASDLISERSDPAHDHDDDDDDADSHAFDTFSSDCTDQTHSARSALFSQPPSLGAASSATTLPHSPQSHYQAFIRPGSSGSSALSGKQSRLSPSASSRTDDPMHMSSISVAGQTDDGTHVFLDDDEIVAEGYDPLPSSSQSDATPTKQLAPASASSAAGIAGSSGAAQQQQHTLPSLSTLLPPSVFAAQSAVPGSSAAPYMGDAGALSPRSKPNSPLCASSAFAGSSAGGGAHPSSSSAAAAAAAATSQPPAFQSAHPAPFGAGFNSALTSSSSSSISPAFFSAAAQAAHHRARLSGSGHRSSGSDMSISSDRPQSRGAESSLAGSSTSTSAAAAAAAEAAPAERGSVSTLTGSASSSSSAATSAAAALAQQLEAQAGLESGPAAASAAAATTTAAAAAPRLTAYSDEVAKALPRVPLHAYEGIKTLGTGTFGRVLLVRLRFPSSTAPSGRQSVYFALKVLQKADIVRLKQVEHINNERDILSQVQHPFIVNLLRSYQDSKSVYMLMDYVPGGEIFSHLRRARRFSADVTRFYIASILLALDYLHSKGVIYRDLKPENLLLDGSGFLKIADFGFAKYVPDNRTWTLCGTPEYLAPEIIAGTGHGKAADYWSLGVLMFECLAGFPPFFAPTPIGVYELILKGVFAFPAHIDPLSRDLISGLLTADRSKRLGNLRGGAEDVRAHPWFAGVNWGALERREVGAPIVPRLASAGDSSYFQRFPEVDPRSVPGMLGPEPQGVSDPYRDLFPHF